VQPWASAQGRPCLDGTAEYCWTSTRYLFRNGRDLLHHSRGLFVIDLFGLEEDEVRERFPAVYQWVKERVKPERDHNNRKSYRDYWWIFGEPRRELREAFRGLDRYIATVETAKHRVFTFLSTDVLPDNKIVAIALDDPFFLGVLSCRQHVVWALAAGGRLGYGNDPVYVKTRCFDPFPFPEADDAQRDRIGQLAATLDHHREERLAEHPELTLTRLYNVLEKERNDEELTERDREVHTQGLVTMLREVHEKLDAAVADAYGWPVDISDEETLERLVALNAERAEEEKESKVRWLRPEFQVPEAVAKETQVMLPGAEEPMAASAAVINWPKSVPAQLAAVQEVLARGGDWTVEQLAKSFRRAPRKKVAEMLASLVSVGLAVRFSRDGEPAWRGVGMRGRGS
jgi:hypothetical protein